MLELFPNWVYCLDYGPGEVGVLQARIILALNYQRCYERTSGINIKGATWPYIPGLNLSGSTS